MSYSDPADRPCNISPDKEHSFSVFSMDEKNVICAFCGESRPVNIKPRRKYIRKKGTDNNDT